VTPSDDYTKQEQQRVALGPGNAACAGIAVWPAAAAAVTAALLLLLLLLLWDNLVI